MTSIDVRSSAHSSQPILRVQERSSAPPTLATLQYLNARIQATASFREPGAAAECRCGSCLRLDDTLANELDDTLANET